MRASLFFQMLAKGRIIDHRKQFRHYYELTRVACFPHISKESKEEISDYYWNGAMTPMEAFERDQFREAMEARAKELEKTYQPSIVCLNFFKSHKKAKPAEVSGG